MLSVYLIAGEASGDALGAALMRELRAATSGDVRFYGIGGEKMTAEGLKSLFPYHDLSRMGFVEVAAHAVTLLSRIHQTVDDVMDKHPRVVVTIDSPGFTVRVVEKLRKQGIKGVRFVHMVAPTVWAWKPERAKKWAKLFDHLLALLPFEPPYFTAEGLASTFIGHPAAFQPAPNAARLKEDFGLDEEGPVVALLPGSRESEIHRHLPVMGQTVAKLAERHPGLSLIVPVASRLLPIVGPYFQSCPYRSVILGDEAKKSSAIAAADVALVKSGTVSLDVAAAGTPQVVMYRAHPLTIAIAKRLVRVAHVSLVNILLKRGAVPEYIQGAATPAALADALHQLLSDTAARDAQRQAFTSALSMLRPHSGERPETIAARVVVGA